MFKKSSFCGPYLCIEVDTNFERPVSCIIGACVEVDKTTDKKVVAIRNSNAPEAVIIFSHDEWKAFVKGIKNGEFDIKD